MKILNLNIGNYDDGSLYIQAHKGKFFIESFLSSYKVKISANDPVINSLNKTSPSDTTVFEEYELNAGTDKHLSADINPYSFNPNIFTTEEDRNMMLFINISTEVFKQLRYYTNCEIISVYQQKKNSTMGAIVLIPLTSEEGAEPYFVIHGQDVKTKKFGIYKYIVKDGAPTFEYTEKLSSSQLNALRKNVEKYSGKPLQFKYSGKKIPSYAICFNSEVDDLKENIQAYGNGTSVDHILKIDDKVEEAAKDPSVLDVLIGDFLCRTKGVILGPKIELTFQQVLNYGVRYLFKFDKNENGDTIVKSVRPK